MGHHAHHVAFAVEDAGDIVDRSVGVAQVAEEDAVFGLQFVCRDVHLRIETRHSPFTCGAQRGEILRLPVAHGEGCYFADERTLDELEAEDRIAFRYVENPNGSQRDIAGVLNAGRNVLGLMPHPERAAEPLMGSSDGLVIFRSLVTAFQPAAV